MVTLLILGMGTLGSIQIDGLISQKIADVVFCELS